MLLWLILYSRDKIAPTFYHHAAMRIGRFRYAFLCMRYSFKAIITLSRSPLLDGSMPRMSQIFRQRYLSVL